MVRKHLEPAKVDGHVTVTVHGHEYTASWSTSGGVITVRHPEYGERRAMLRGSGAGGEEMLARMLLREMVPGQ